MDDDDGEHAGHRGDEVGEVVRERVVMVDQDHAYSRQHPCSLPCGRAR
jgi:hypothetical protein